MRVLYILSSNVMGGATISFLNIIKNFKKEEVDPIVIIPSQWEWGKLEELLTQNRIEYYHTPLFESVLPKFSIRYSLKWIAKYLVLHFQKKSSLRGLQKIVRSVKPDIIHTNSGVIHEGFHVAGQYNIPHVWHIREYQTEDFNWYIYPSYKKFCSYLRESYVITITKSLKTYFNLNDSNKAFTIYNGIFGKEEYVDSFPKENFFLMASRISPEKGHSDVIKAFASFSRKDEYRLVIAGFGKDSYMEELKELSKKNKCEDRVDFIGFYKDVKPLISKAKALVVASYNEGFGRMTAEAAFCSTLIIGRDTAGTKEIMDITGGLPFSTIEEMTAQMEKVSTMNDEEYRVKAQVACKLAVENYSIENNVRKISDLYQTILNNINQ